MFALNKRGVMSMVRKLLLQWLPAIVILGYALFVLLEKFFSIPKESPIDFLINMIFLLIVLPIIFCVQGMASYYFRQSVYQNYLVSVVSWLFGSLIIAPEANSIYFMMYSFCFIVGVLMAWLFKRTYLNIPEYDI